MSPTLQRDRIAQWAAAHDHTIVERREDLDVSGGKAGRQNLHDLVEMVERKQLDGIVVAKLDRFARSIIEGVSLIERIDDAGGSFVAVADGFDTRTPYGRLALNIMLSFAQFELERHRENWREARRKMIDQGRHHGPTNPVGYIRGDDGRLTPGPDADTITEMFRRRAAGESPSDLGRWLAAQGIVTGRGGIPGHRYVADLIANRVYLGQARAGEMTNDEAHDPLIDSVTWERANRAAGPRPARSTNEPAALSSLVRCAQCRYTMGAAWSPYADGKRRAYRCSGRHSAGTCPGPAFALEEHLLPIVTAEFFRQLGSLKMAAAGDTAVMERLREARDMARRDYVAFRDLPGITDILGPDDFEDGLRVRRAQVETAEAALAAEMGKRPDGLPDVAPLRMAWPELDTATRLRMFRAVFACVAVRKPTVHRSHSEPLVGRVWFLPAGRLPADIPTPGRPPGRIVPFRLDDPDGPWIPAREPLAENRGDI